MLNRLTKYYSPLLLYSKKSFGSSHGTPVKVQINKQATWLKFKTSRKLQAVDGISDTHIPFPDFLDVDPIPHLRDAPWYDVQNMFRGDMYYHSPQHQPHSTRQQGYFFFEDLHDPRYDMIIPGIYTAGSVVTVIIMLCYSDLNVAKSLEELVAEADTIQQKVHRRLQQKADRIKELTQEISKL